MATAIQDADRPTREEMLQRARDLVPTLLERADETEKMRRIHPDTVRDMHDLGLWRILTPAKWGGYEFDYGMVVEMAAELARGCMSTGWIHMNVISHEWMMAMWPAEAQDEVWGTSPDTLIGSALIYPPGKVTKADGGWILNGRWPFSSGIDACNWIMLGGMERPDGDDGPVFPRLFVVKTEDIEVIDTWFVSGLAGSGSKDVACEDLFVPDHMSIRGMEIRGGPTPGADRNPQILYQLPVLALFPHIVAAPVLGCAMGAYDDYVSSVKSKVSTYNASKLADHTTTQIKISDGGVRLQAAKLLLLDNCREAAELAEAGVMPTYEHRARWRRDAAWAGKLSIEVVNLVNEAIGGGANYLGNPMQRRFRDAHAGYAHIQLSWDINAAEFGRVSLGMEPQNKGI